MLTLLVRAGFVGANKEFPRQTFAFSVDGIASIIGSLMGTSPVRRAQSRPARRAWSSAALRCVMQRDSWHAALALLHVSGLAWWACQRSRVISMPCTQVAAFIESAAGIREGGRTGLTALTAAWWFFVSLFFTPILCAPEPENGFVLSILTGAVELDTPGVKFALHIVWQGFKQQAKHWVVSVVDQRHVSSFQAARAPPPWCFGADASCGARSKRAAIRDRAGADHGGRADDAQRGAHQVGADCRGAAGLPHHHHHARHLLHRLRRAQDFLPCIDFLLLLLELRC